MPTLGQRDVDDVAERALRVVGDADPQRVALGGADPLVLGGVLQVLGRVHARNGTQPVAPRSLTRAQFVGWEYRGGRSPGRSARMTTCWRCSARASPPARLAVSATPPGMPIAVASVGGSPIARIVVRDGHRDAVDRDAGAGRR